MDHERRRELPAAVALKMPKDDMPTDVELNEASRETAIEGVVPARQARSEATFVALVDAGRKLLETKTFDQMTISEIAKASGASVSSFYARFKDKEAYFAFIQERAMAEVETGLVTFLDGLAIGEIDDGELISALSGFWVRIYRRNRGIYRASFKHASAHPDIWEPFKRTGWRAATLVAARLSRHFDTKGLRFSERDLRIGLQLANGALINAAVNDPGPIGIDDPEMERHIARLLALFLGLPPDCIRMSTRSLRKRRKQ